MDNIDKVISLIDSTLKEDAINSISSGNIIKDGFDKEVDETRDIINNAKDWLVNYQNKLIEETEIQKLKIKHTNVFGYFIEVPLSAKNSVPDYFVHKQTLVSAIRFITPELKDFERKVVEGESILVQREYNLFQDLRSSLMEYFDDLKAYSNEVGDLDTMCSLSSVSAKNNYVRPSINKGHDLVIKSGRHPVIESIESDFISNDLSLDEKEHLHIITGPNMGGKSTFLRQNALIILMAHLGCFVPAKEAIIPLTDKIFSRVGASDNLFLGQSTFMVEMQEMAYILNNYTEDSFVIIDEIGRGTSTYDGMGIARAVLKNLHDKKKVKTLFATHYHELVDESSSLPGCQNFSVAVGENNEGIVFLRKIIKGGIKKSYGLEVAKLGGITDDVIAEARDMLQKMENMHSSNNGGQLSLGNFGQPEKVRVEYVEKKSEVEEKLKEVDVNNLTPMEALNIINSLKESLK